MDDNKRDDLLDETEAKEAAEELSAEELRIKEEMEELARTFQEELNKAKAEEAQLALERQEQAEEADILIQELEAENEEESLEEIPEEELCECCGEKRRGTKSNPDSPYCRSCDKALRHYPFELLSVLLVLIVIGFSFYACYCFSQNSTLYATALQADKHQSKARLYSAYTSYSKSISLMESSKINGELVYKRAVNNMYLIGSLDTLTDYEEQFKSWEIKLPHLRRAYNIFKAKAELDETQAAAYEVLSEYMDSDDVDYSALPFDEIIAKLDAISEKSIEPNTDLVELEDGEEFITSAYKKDATVYNSSMLNFFKFYIAAVCEKDYQTQIGFLEEIKNNTPELTWLYDTVLGDLYIKNGQDVTDYCDFLLKLNKENSGAYVIKATALRVSGDYDAAIELAQKYIDLNDEYSYEFLRQQALCYLIKGEYKKAYDAANSSYQLNGNSLQSIDTLALCCLASKNTATYEELSQLLTDNGFDFSDEVLGYKDGKLTLEDILTKGDFDLE